MASTDRQRWDLPRECDDLFKHLASVLDEYLEYRRARPSESWNQAYAREVERVFWQVHFASIKVRESLAKKIELDRSLGKYGPVPPETGVEWKERIERDGFSEQGERGFR